jgi:hypothetical protein
MESSPKQPAQDRLLPVWLALGLVLALFVGTGAGVLAWLSGQVVAAAVLTGGVAFGGTATLAVLIITLLRR